ncbi:sugar ABC transporter substrate-binding protein [bacterium LRH843]|nr:sugar ABC transporter substrate-binding protein [bacterium LRH843]
MKKSKGLILALLLILIMSIALVGCGGEETAGGSEETPADTTETEENGNNEVAKEGLPSEGLIALSHKSLDYYAFVAMQEGAKKKAGEYGWDFESAVANSDSATQMNHIVNFISKKPLAIIADPIDSEGIITAVNNAVDAGIPVGVFDTPTTGGDVAMTVVFDNYKAGAMAAEEIVKRLEEKYGEAKGIVLNAYGAMSSSAWRARKEGFDDVMAKYPNINYLAMPAEGDMRLTQDVALNAIAQHGFIDAVHAPSDNPAMGLYEALKQTDNLKKVGEEGHVIFVTVDAEPIALQRVEEGWYDATINQDCIAYGELIVELLADYTLQGKEFEVGSTYENDKYYWKSAEVTEGDSGPQIIIDPYVIDSSNVDDPSHWGNIAWNEYGIRY